MLRERPFYHMGFARAAAFAGLLCAGCSPRIETPVHVSSAPAPAPLATYPAGTTIARLPVGGLTEDQAGHALRLQAKSWAARRVSLRYGAHAYTRRWSELGVAPDTNAMLNAAWKTRQVPLAVTVSLPQAKKSLLGTARALNVAPVAPRFQGAPPDAAVLPGREGRKVNVPLSAERVSATLARNPAATSVRLAVFPAPPPFSEEDLQDARVPVASFATRFNPGQADRTHNLRLVTSRLNGALVMPGKVFSFNDWVGERRAQDGFREAIVYKEGQMVKDIGGGLCQVSSTLYNVALTAGLPIVERSHHSLTVHYVPLGRDATVYWGQHDLRFRNNTATPLYIRAATSGGTLRIEAWGRAPLQRKVTITSASGYRDGQAYARVFRTIAENGARRHELVSDDSYSTEHKMAVADSHSPRT